MDADRFDSLTRLLFRMGATDATRRSVTRLSGRLLVGALLASTLGEDESAARKKRKKKKKKRPTPSSPPPPGASPPPSPSGCADGQQPCDGTCILNSQCCDNADCQVSGQICNKTTRQCACPAALPEICGGACLAACPAAAGQVRNPDTCGCCIIGGIASGGIPGACCSGMDNQEDLCVGRGVGSNCSFHYQCAPFNCVQGLCSPCNAFFGDYCQEGQTCASGTGRCLTHLDGSIRCGVRLFSFECGLCQRDLDCDQGQGLGYFCARATTQNCLGCGLGETFCARP